MIPDLKRIRIRWPGPLAASLLVLCLGLPQAVAAERSPVAKAVQSCLYNISGDQTELQGKLTTLGWRPVTSPEALKSLSLLGGLTGLVSFELGVPLDKAAEAAAKFDADTQSDPQVIFANFSENTRLYTHPKYGGTLLHTFGKPGRQFCRMALTYKAYDDEFLYQLRIAAEVSDGERGMSFEKTTHPGDIVIFKTVMQSNLSGSTKQGDTAKPGADIGKVRLRQFAPSKASRAAFKDAFGARSYLSILAVGS